jgi:gliding motility-associated-like protein
MIMNKINVLVAVCLLSVVAVFTFKKDDNTNAIEDMTVADSNAAKSKKEYFKTNDEGKKFSNATEVGKGEFLGVVPSFAQQIKDGTIKYADPNRSKEYNPKINNRQKDWKGNAPAEKAHTTTYTNLQTENGTSQSAAPLSEFEVAAAGATPTDPTGAAGPSHYVNSWNSSFSIWLLDGTNLLSNASLGTLWAGQTLGDPIVFYDTIQQRFVITQFSNSPNGFLFAVCQGNDPFNDGWYTYRFNTQNPASFPDYPKYSVWSDGYYITANKDSGSQTSSEVVYVVESDKMACGITAQYAGFPLPGSVTSGFYSPGAANIVGYEIPPPGNCPIFYMQDDDWAGVTDDHIKIWEIDMDWVTIASSTIAESQTLGAAEGVTAYDGLFDGGSFSNLPQPGADLDALQATIMYMTNYRMFPTHNSIVLNFVVDLDGNDNLAGIRWYELRQTAHGMPWTVFQEGTLATGLTDGLSRFSGSINIDGHGNIGLGYTVCAATVNPELRFTGRLASDPLGSMTVAEDVIQAGTTGDPATRYGDYSQLTLDPTDNRTFWHLGEIFKSGGGPTRRNHVGSFRIGADDAVTVGVFDLQAPVLAGSATETITVTLENYGTSSQGNFPVQYSLNAGAVITETYTGTLAPGATDTFSFTTTADMSVAGTYMLDVRTALATDTFAPDDGFTIPVKSVAQNDLAVSAIVTPVSGPLTNAETITITIDNLGSTDQSNFDVQYTIDAGTPVVETFTGTVVSGGSQNYVFTTTADLSVLGSTYAICGKTNLATDELPTNDEFCANIIHESCAPEGDCSFGDGVTILQLGTIDHTSTCSATGYIDSTAISTDLDRDAVNNPHVGNIQVGYDGDEVIMWIDFNDDGVFADPAEQVLAPLVVAGADTDTAINITIPPTTPLGPHTLRVKAWDPNFGGDNTPCGDVQYGRIEDFTINVTECVGNGTDTDGDTIDDNCDDDDDNDGILDVDDNCPLVANSDQADADNDNIGDVCDDDMDNDGITDDVDNCPNDPNPDQADEDNDGIGDVCDPVNNNDTDGDGIIDADDNCPDNANTDQVDVDLDGIGDVCDPVNDILIDISNGFSPNGDTINDVWFIDNIWLYPNATIKVFNRWGNKVFTTTGYNNDWNGESTEGGSGKLPTGSYYYIVTLNQPSFGAYGLQTFTGWTYINY